MPETAARSAPAGRALGKYMLVGRLAHGGMGEILLARMSGALGFDKYVVIKRLRRHLAGDERSVRAFLDEARLVARISHPNVCQVYELGFEHGRHYLAMEYLEGMPLSALIRRASRDRTPLDLRALGGLMEQVCEGLYHVHTLKRPNGSPANVVHRDVSPQNLFVTTSGAAKILDFGIAKSWDSTVRTPTGRVKGKSAYMSPEQIRGGALDHRSDIYSLGVVLYEAVSGRPLFERGDVAETFRAIREDTLPFLRDVPAELNTVIQRAMARDRDERYASARELGHAVSEAMKNQGGSMSTAEMAEWLAVRFSEDLRDRRERVAQAIATQMPAGQGDGAVSGSAGAAGSFDPQGRLEPGTVIAGGAAGSAGSGTVSLSPPAEEVWSQSSLRDAPPADADPRDADVDESDSVADVTLPAVARAPAAGAGAVDRVVAAVGRTRPRRRETALPLAPPPLHRARSGLNAALADPSVAETTLPDPTLPDPTLPDPTIESPPPHAPARGALLLPAVRGRPRWTRLALAGGGAAVVVGLILALWLGGGGDSKRGGDSKGGGGARLASGMAAGSAAAPGSAAPEASSDDAVAGGAGEPARAAVRMNPAEAAARPAAARAQPGTHVDEAELVEPGAAEGSPGEEAGASRGAGRGVADDGERTPVGAVPHLGQAAAGAPRAEAAPAHTATTDTSADSGDAARPARALQAKAPTHGAAAHPARSAPPSHAPPPHRRRSAATQPDARDGYFTVDSMPYATIYVDGARRGVTPLLRLPLSPGRHHVVAVTADKRRQSLTITIESGAEARRRRLIW